MTVDTSSAGDSTVGEGAVSPLDTAIAAAEAVLAERFGSAITLVDAEDLAGSGPATVVRARVASSPFSLPRTLVIKHYPGTPAPGEPDPFAREAASYQLFTALAAEDRVCPEMLAHSGAKRVLVIDDLGRVPTLEDKLRAADSRAAEAALLSWARSLGRMHATTAGREADFDALLRRLSARAKCEDGRSGSSRSRADDEAMPVVACSELLRDSLGVTTPEEVRDAVEQAAGQVRAPAYRAFSPVDLWPDNNLVTDEGVRFLDFERGAVRSALVDVAHLRVPFVSSPEPMALPAGMSEAMVAAWRAEVSDLWPAFTDDETLTSYLLDMQALLVWRTTWRRLPELASGEPAGRVAAALAGWWRGLSQYAARGGADALAAHATSVADALDTRFGPGLELPYYPAFH